MNEQTTRLVLVRHGQTAWNRDACSRGRADLTLDKVTLKQAAATARYLARRWPAEAVYASPMKRAMETAEAVAEIHGLTEQASADLLDIDFGAWQGQGTSKEI
jgi:probable phosphoglycerate mutase